MKKIYGSLLVRELVPHLESHGQFFHLCQYLRYWSSMSPAMQVPQTVGSTLCISSLVEFVHIYKTLPTNTILISIIWWLIGVNYFPILLVTHLDLMMHLMALNNLRIYCISRTLSLSAANLKAMLILNCFLCYNWNNNCDGKKWFHLVLSKLAENCCNVYILPMSSSAGVALHSQLQVPVRQLKGEHLTERKYSLHRFVILVAPLIWLDWGRGKEDILGISV